MLNKTSSTSFRWCACKVAGSHAHQPYAPIKTSAFYDTSCGVDAKHRSYAGLRVSRTRPRRADQRRHTDARGLRGAVVLLRLVGHPRAVQLVLVGVLHKAPDHRDGLQLALPAAHGTISRRTSKAGAYWARPMACASTFSASIGVAAQRHVGADRRQRF
jgi:hypothetical protein